MLVMFFKITISFDMIDEEIKLQLVETREFSFVCLSVLDAYY